MVQTPDAVMKELKAGRFAPVYFLHGEEAYYLDIISEYIEQHALPAHERGFNQLVLYGKDINIGTIINQARRFPMMAERQVVIVKELLQMSDWGKDTANEMLEKYLAQPQVSTILVLNHKYKALAKNTRLYKALDKAAIIVESPKIKDYKVSEWIIDYLRQQDRKIEPQAAQLLAEAIGNDLGRLHTELSKISLNLSAEQVITPQTVEEFVGISRDYNVFELQKAIAERNAPKALQIVGYCAANPKKMPLIPSIALLYGFFSKLLLIYGERDRSDAHLAKVLSINPYSLKDYRKAMEHHSLTQILAAIQLLHQADLQAKGIVESGSSTDAQILEDMVFRIITAEE